MLSLARRQYERFRQLGYEFAKFAVIGVAGVFITNAVYDLLFIHLGVGPVKSTTIATLFRFWSYRRFVWVTPPASRAGGTGGLPRPADRPPLASPNPDREGTPQHS